jgi:toxin ParE1/3/4
LADERLPVDFHPLARRDLTNIYTAYETEHPGLGQTFIEKTEALVERIGEWPRMYATIDGELRAARIKRFPYLFVYEVLDDRVQILCVSHAMRDDAVWRLRMTRQN